MIMILMIEMMMVFIAVPLTPHSRAAVFLGTGTKSSLKASYDDDDDDNDDNDDAVVDDAVVDAVDDDQCDEE
jgi:hypothetical protein